MFISEANKACSKLPNGATGLGQSQSANNGLTTEQNNRLVGPLKGLQTQLTNLSNANNKLRGKAALELKEWKNKGIQTVQEIRQKVKEEIKQFELNEVSRRKNESGGWVLSPSQMRHIREQPYQYNASAGSYLELFCLQRFWLWLARFIPSFVAPSVITCLGLAINIACCLNVLAFSPDLKSDAPSWTFLLCAIGVFLYQTLDALDGKQSFKVQNSQIEEVYDHGCDAVSTIFVMLATAIATQLGYYPHLLYPFFVLSMVAFYCTHWLCHVTHTMVFGKVDVSEAQWTMILVHLLTMFYGQRLWQTVLFSVFGGNIQLVHLIALCTYGSLIRSIVENGKMALMGLPTPLEAVGINIPRRSSVIQPLIPLGLLVTLTHFCYVKGLFTVSQTIFCLTFGLSFAKLTMKLVMMNISHGDMDYFDSSLAVPFLLAANILFPLLKPETALICGLIYSIMDSLRFFTYSSWDLRQALDVNIFTIKYPVGHPKNRNGDNGFYLNGLNTPKVIAAWKDYQESLKREQEQNSYKEQTDE